MSFLTGLLSAGRSVVKFFSGNSLASGLAKTALIGFAVNQLSRNALKDNAAGTSNIDQGVRLQARPQATAKIPVLYGSAFFGGNITDAAMTNNNKTMWYSLVLAETTGTVSSTSTASTYTIGNCYWNNQRVVFKADGFTVDYTVDTTGVIDRSLSGLVELYFYAGGYNQGIMPQGSAGIVPSAATIFPNWTAATHAMSNLLFMLVKVNYNRERGVVGIGDILVHATNSMRLPGDVISDYLTNTRYGAGIAAANVITSDITALNNYSAESVAYADQGTGAQTLADRYQINGLIDTANPVLQNAEAILSAAGSWLSYDSHLGQWGIVINRVDAPVAAFDNSNIIGSISVNGTGLTELYNEVKVEFPHKELKDSADFYNIQVPTAAIPADWTAFSRNANEPDNVLNLTYDIINEPIQAQMLGLIELKQSRLDRVIQFTTDYSYYNIKAGDIVTVTNDLFGFNAQEFRVITVREQQGEEAALQLAITALEYNATVYSIADLYRFTRSDANGIITIGSIGQPGTPIVNKVETDARPRLLISSTAPTGIVEGLEYWLTTDVGIPEDANRSYTLIGVRRPEGGGVFTSGTSVTLEYTTSSGNFLVKTRGFNTQTVGLFSTPSGLIEFAPVQTTDLITEETSVAGLLGTLAVTTLLNTLGDLFTDANNNNKSLFDRIFETFNDETGVDIVGDAAAGNLVVAANIAVSSNGTPVGNTVSSFDFISPIEAVETPATTVKLIDGQANKDILAWNAEDNEWQLISDCIACDFPAPPPPPPPPPAPCSLTIANRLPVNNFSLGDLCAPNSTVPYLGSYFIKFNIDPGDQSGDFSKVTPMALGTGTARLYGTDGVLEQTLSANQLKISQDTVQFPWAPRIPGKDYYILLDEGLVVYCGCESQAILTAEGWTFTTSLAPQPPYAGIMPTAIPNLGYRGTDSVPDTVIDFTATPVGTLCSTGGNLTLTFSTPVQAGQGQIQIRATLSGALIQNLPVSNAVISNNQVNFGSITGLEADKSYTVTAPEGLLVIDTAAVSNAQGSGDTVCGVLVNIPEPVANGISAFKSWGLITRPPLEYLTSEFCLAASDRVKLDSNIQVIFTKNFGVQTPGPAFVHIYESTGILHQSIDLRGDFDPEGYGDIYGFESDTLTLNPTRPFKPNTSYYLIIPAGVIIDSQCNIPFAGITSPSTITWQTEGIVVTAVNPTPTYGSVYIDLEFDRPVTPGPGRIIVTTAAGELITTVDSKDWAMRSQDTRF